MAVTLTCPNCDKTLRLKNDPGGKKVRCPACGESFAPEDEAIAEKPQKKKIRQPVPDDDEEPDSDEELEEEKPKKKKKKKKKQKSNTTLYVALGGGAAALIALILVLVLFVFPKSEEKPLAKGPPPPGGPGVPPMPGPAPFEPPGKQPIGGIPRRMEISEVRNLMKQLGVAYHNFFDVHRRGPKDAKELAIFFDKNTRITQALNEKWIAFQWGAHLLKMTEGTSRTIIAYETQADRNGQRVVLFGDASVTELNETEFAKAPRAN